MIRRLRILDGTVSGAKSWPELASVRIGDAVVQNDKQPQVMIWLADEVGARPLQSAGELEQYALYAESGGLLWTASSPWTLDQLLARSDRSLTASPRLPSGL